MMPLARRRNGLAQIRMVSPSDVAGGVLLDTGVLLALYARDDPKHVSVTRWMAGFRGSLHTVESVLTEAAYFLSVRSRAALADLVMSGNQHLHHPDAAGYVRMAELLRKYADIATAQRRGRI